MARKAKSLINERWIVADDRSALVMVGVTGSKNDAELVADCYGDKAVARLVAAAPEIRDALDLATATLENVLLCHGKAMSVYDRQGRKENIRYFRSLLARL